jgi:hypothetical protein
MKSGVALFSGGELRLIPFPGKGVTSIQQKKYQGNRRNWFGAII